MGERRRRRRGRGRRRRRELKEKMEEKQRLPGPVGRVAGAGQKGTHQSCGEVHRQAPLQHRRGHRRLNEMAGRPHEGKHSVETRRKESNDGNNLQRPAGVHPAQPDLRRQETHTLSGKTPRGGEKGNLSRSQPRLSSPGVPEDISTTKQDEIEER